MKNALGITAIMGPLCVALAGFWLYPATSSGLLYALLVVPGVPATVIAARILLRRPELLVRAEIRAAKGGRYISVALLLLFAVLAGALAGVSTYGGAYLLNGLWGEQTLHTLPCAVTEVSAAASSSRGGPRGRLNCMEHDGNVLALDLFSEAQLQQAQSGFPPGTRLEVNVYEGSLGLRYTAGLLVNRVISRPGGAGGE